MKNFFVWILISELAFSSFFSILPLTAHAATGVPQILSYQGRLRDSGGAVLGGSSGTTYYFKFSIWDNSSVGSGTKLWPTAAPGSTTATVTNGIFNVKIGDTGAGYPDALTYNFQDNKDVYLQIEVSTDNLTFETLNPRQRVTSAGFAINSGTVQGFTPSQTPTGSEIPVLTSGNLLLSGTNPQINATSTNALLLQGGGGTGDIQFFSSSNKITAAGNLTIAGTLSAATGTFTGLSATTNGLALSSSTPATTTNTLYNLGGSLYFNGSVVGSGGGGSASGTAGLIQFSNGSGGFNASSLFNWDNTTSRLALGTSAAASTTLHVVGAATITGISTLATTTATALTVSGLSTLGNVSSTNITASGVLGVAGQSTLGNVSSTNLGVSGNTALATTSITALTVSGQSTFANVSSTDLSVSGALAVTGLSSLAGITFTSATGTGSFQVATLTTTGLATLDSLSVSGQSTLANVSSTNITASGFLNGASLNISGQSILANVSSTNITASGFLSSATLNVSGASILSGTLAVSGTSTLATTTATGLTISTNGLTLSSSTPATLSNTLYNLGGNLYFNGSLLGVAGAGLQSLNALTTTTQFLAVGSSGTDFNIVSSSTTHTFNLPDASATNRGVVTTSTQTFAGNKTFSGQVTVSGTSTLATTTATSLTVSGLSTLGNVSSTNLSASGVLGVTGQSTLGNVSSTNITASGFLNGASLNISGQSILANVSSTNITASGFLNSATLNVSGAALLSGTLTVSGTSTLATTTATGLTISTNGITISSSTPATTTQTLYALGSTLYFNGSTVGGGSAASGTAGLVQFSNGSGGFNANTLFNWNNSTNRLGLGTSAAPSSTLHVVGDFTVTATSSLQGQTTIDDLILGALAFEADSGILSWVDMPISTSVATNTVESYSAKIDGTDILTVYAQANGSGGIQNQGVAVGTSTPYGVFTVATGSIIGLNISSAGLVGIGTSATPSSTLHVVGSATVTGQSSFANVSSTNLQASGNTTLATTTATSLTVSGLSTLGNVSSTNLSASGVLNVTGATVLGSTLNVSGQSTLANVSSTNITASGFLNGATLNISGQSILANVSSTNITASGFLSSATLNVSGASILSGTLNVAGTSTFATTTATTLTVGSTATPSSTLHVVGSFQVTGTSTLSGVTTIDDLIVGASIFETNAGMVTWTDLPVTSAAATDTVESYIAQIDGNPLLSLYAQSDGHGGIKNAGVGIGTTTPTTAKFTIAGDGISTSTSAFIIYASNGSSTLRAYDDGSIVVGNPSSGPKGTGTINAQAVYDDNTLLTDYVFDKYFTGTVIDEDKELHGDYEMLTIDQMFEFAKTNKHLPTIPGRQEWKAKKGFSIGELASHLWESVETQALYIGELNSRLASLETASGTLMQGNVNSGLQLTTDTNIVVRDAEFNGSIVIKGLTTLSKDSAGQAKILPGQQTVRVTFGRSYPTKPIITATVVDAFTDARYAVMHADATGFNIDLDRSVSEAVVFDWHAFAASTDAQIFVSDGSRQDITLTVIDPIEPPTNPDPQEDPPVITDPQEDPPVITEPEEDPNASSTPPVIDPPATSTPDGQSDEDPPVVEETPPTEEAASTPQV